MQQQSCHCGLLAASMPTNASPHQQAVAIGSPQRGVFGPNVSPGEPSYRSDVDGLRAVAVTAVIAFHTAPAAVAGGFLGVDVFFVISGFLISRIILTDLVAGRFSFERFYLRRARRILPALVVVCSAALVLGWIVLLPDELAQLGEHVTAGMLFLSNFQLWKEVGYFDAAAEQKPLLHLWSLGIEEQFYMAWPITLVLLHRYHRSLSLWIPMLAICSLGLCGWIADSNPSGAFYLPLARFWQPLAGALLAIRPVPALRGSDAIRAAASDGRARRWVLHVTSVLGAALISAAFVGLYQDGSNPALRSVFPTLGAVLLIAAGRSGIINRLLARTPAVFIGRISYSLYLWHWPLLSYLAIVQPEGVSITARLGVVLISLVLASLTYYLVEVRTRHASWLGLPQLGAMAAISGALGAVLLTNSGFAQLRGPWNIEALPVPPDPKRMQTAACVARHGPLYVPRLIPERDFCTDAEGVTDLSTVTVIGDSHANRLFLGLRVIDRARRYRNLGRGTCVPFLGYDGSVATTGYELQCAETLKNILTRIPAAMLGTPVLHGYFVRAYAGAFASRTPQQAEPQARATLELLVHTARRAIVVLDVPVLPFEPRSCVVRHGLAGLARARCSFPTAQWSEDSMRVNRDIRAAARNLDRVEVFDPASVLCDAVECHAVREGKLLYMDEHHLSQDGAELVARALRDRIDSLSASHQRGR